MRADMFQIIKDFEITNDFELKNDFEITNEDYDYYKRRLICTLKLDVYVPQ